MRRKRYPLSLLESPNMKRVYDTYAADIMGNIFCIKSDYLLLLKQRWNGKAYVVSIHTKERNVMSVMADAFLPPLESGYTRYHLNGIKSDNRLCNIGVISQVELGKLSGKTNRKMVVRTMNGKETYYKSLTECAKANGYSKSQMGAICRGETESPGARFRYEEE